MHKKIDGPVYIFLGPPGAGKGSQAKRLATALDIPHISTGDLLRGQSNKDTPLSNRIKSLLNAGQLVPDPIIVEALLDRVEQKDCQEGFILDGFPRNLAQCHILDKYTENPEDLIFIEVSLDDSIILKRLTGRRICPQCQHVYHIEFAAPEQNNTCDKCKVQLHIRHDDQEEVILERLAIFKKEYDPMKKYYETRPRWISISSTASPSQCFSTLLENLSERVPNFMLNSTLTT